MNNGSCHTPIGWQHVTLADISASIQYGYTTSAIEKEAGIKFLRITDIQNGRVDWPKVPSCIISADEISRYRLRPGDLVFARTGATTGKSFLIRSCPEAVFASYLIRVRLSPGADESFVSLFFQSPDYWRQIEAGKRGIGQPNVNGQVLAQIRLPLPPVAEQRRIVAKIEELFSELDKGIENLKQAKAQLAVYRQALLKHAFEGKLSCDGVTGDTADHWKWQSLGQIAEVSGGLTKNPRRESLPRKMKYLRVANVYADRLDLEDVREIGVTDDEVESVSLQKGDLLVVEGNGSIDQIGRVAEWAGAIVQCGHQNHLIRVRLQADKLPRFVLLYLQSPAGRDAIIKAASSTSGLYTLSISKVANLGIPLAPLPEQHSLLALLEPGLDNVLSFQSEIETNLTKAEALRQAVLKKAFCGQLVHQGPNDESASAPLAASATPATAREHQLNPAASVTLIGKNSQ